MNTQKRMSKEDKADILEMHKNGMTNIDISKKTGFSNTGVRFFLNKMGLESNKPQRDTSRFCQICGVIFIPKSDDGIKKNKYLNCSRQCSNVSRKIRKRSKYSKNQIKEVIRLKKEKFTNDDICNITKVNINTVKSIIRENSLTLSSEDAQSNAYSKKIEKNPNAMEDMRNIRMECPTNEFNIKINKIKTELDKKGNKKSIPLLCKEYGLQESSVRRSMHGRGWSDLIGKQISGPEYEIHEFISSYLPDIEIEQGNRKILKGKEIDIYIPSLNLGIEFCGLYWHNELSPQPRDKKYHYEKMKQCEEKGIRLITIFEDEWLERQKQVKNYLKSVLGINEKRVYARKCKAEEIPKDIAKKFLEDNHIQGKTVFKKAFGLHYEGELLGLVTSNTHHRQGHIDKNVLNRLVFADGVQVIGGASKLLKYLINYSKEQGYSVLLSWSDNRWSQGNVYEKIGFNLTEELGPDYSYYVGGSKRQSKQSNKKKLLIEKGAIGDMSMTERELALTIEFYRVWDCGKKRWEIKL